MVVAELERGPLVELRSVVGLDLILGDQGEGIRCCRICTNVHPKSYGDIVYRALQRDAIIEARE